MNAQEAAVWCGELHPVACAALVTKLETVLTIDGKGRPSKARSLLQIFDHFTLDELRVCLIQISEREHF